MSHFKIYKAYHEMKKGYTKPYTPTRKQTNQLGTILAIGNISNIRVGEVLLKYQNKN